MTAAREVIASILNDWLDDWGESGRSRVCNDILSALDTAGYAVVPKEAVSALRHCLGILCESGNLNNYRNLSDAELGRAWTTTAKEAGNVLNAIDGLPHYPLSASAKEERTGC